MLFSVLTPGGDLIRYQGRVIVGTLAALEHTGIAQIPRLSRAGWLTVHVPAADVAALDPPPITPGQWLAAAQSARKDPSP